MADGSTLQEERTKLAASQALGDALARDRHIVALCLSPPCQRSAVCDPTPWLHQHLEQLPLTALASRVRCICGSRAARLEIRAGPAQAASSPALFIFR